MPQGCYLASFVQDCYHNEIKSVRVLLIISAYFCWVKIPLCQLHDSYIWSPNTRNMRFPKTSALMINPDIINTQYSPSCMNMNDVILQYTKHQKETQNLTKSLRVITHLSTLLSARKISTHNANPLTTVEPVPSIITTTNLQLGCCMYNSHWPKSLQWENSQCDHACVAKPHLHQQQDILRQQQGDQEHIFGRLHGIADV